MTEANDALIRREMLFFGIMLLFLSIPLTFRTYLSVIVSNHLEY